MLTVLDFLVNVGKHPRRVRDETVQQGLRHLVLDQDLVLVVVGPESLLLLQLPHQDLVHPVPLLPSPADQEVLSADFPHQFEVGTHLKIPKLLVIKANNDRTRQLTSL